jgi:hypothetical protein
MSEKSQISAISVRTRSFKEPGFISYNLGTILVSNTVTVDSLSSSFKVSPPPPIVSLQIQTLPLQFH